jgi:hypothetical protein
MKAVTKISSCGTDLVIVPKPCMLPGGSGDKHLQCVSIYRLRVLSTIICYTNQTKTHLSDATLYLYMVNNILSIS